MAVYRVITKCKCNVFTERKSVWKRINADSPESAISQAIELVKFGEFLARDIEIIAVDKISD